MTTTKKGRERRASPELALRTRQDCYVHPQRLRLKAAAALQKMGEMAKCGRKAGLRMRVQEGKPP